jgi:hypothetical protein
MAISVTSDQINSLAPDAASLKAARSLASPRTWSELGRDDRAIWGACQGSAKDPYRTQVDWQGPAFKCTCPSRKFPCKHGLALLLLLAEQPALFISTEAPEWVASWIQSRSQRAEAKAAETAGPVDEAARSKRVEQRFSRISQGLEDLELWLRDLVEQGLASVPSRGFDFWDTPAARLVDAQAPGVARRVRQMASIAASGEAWQTRMLHAIAQLELLIAGWRRIDALPEATQADLRTAVGIPVPQEDVLASTAHRDLWFVAGQRIDADDRLRVQRSWLIGAIKERAALILDFAVGTASFKTNLLPASVIDAEICFFPGAAPLRAAIRAIHGAADAPSIVPGRKSLAAAFEDFGARSAANPWTENQPASLHAVTPIAGPSGWFLRDAAGAGVPVRPDFTLLAVSGGLPVDLFGEWNGEQFLALLASAHGRYIPLQAGSAA